MNVMVTGATAPLGAAIVNRLLSRPDVDRVLAIGRRPTTTMPSDPRLEYRAVNLAHRRALHDLVWGEARELEIEAVVHGVHRRRAADHGRPVHIQNVKTTRELVTECTGHPTIRKLVYRSFAEVYAAHAPASTILDEDGALDFEPTSPQWVRDRVEADVAVCGHFGRGLDLTVLRCAEIFAPGTGSQLWDYLQSRVCLRPLGFDPMLNLLSLEDAATAFIAALYRSSSGVFNVPGCDTLPLSAAIAESRRADVPVPGLAMAPLYGLRRWITGFDFRYDVNVRRFHHGGVLDGRRALAELGYAPGDHVVWPKPWWMVLVERLAVAAAR